MLLGERDRPLARWRHERGEHDARARPRGEVDAVAEARDGVEHGTGRAGERPAIDQGERRAAITPATDESRAIGLPLNGAGQLAVDRRAVHRRCVAGAAA